MLGRKDTVAVKGFELPNEKGATKLILARQYKVLGITSNSGKNWLLVEQVVGSSARSQTFTVIENDDEITPDEDATHVGFYEAGGKILHVYGARQSRWQGGPAGV